MKVRARPIKIEVKPIVAALAKIPSKVSAAAKPKIEWAWKQAWRAGTDPYGVAWTALRPATVRRRGSATPILIRTRALIGSAQVNPMAGAGLSASVGFPGTLHQTGTSRMVARKVLPYVGLPDAWKAAIARAVKEVKL